MQDGSNPTPAPDSGGPPGDGGGPSLPDAVPDPVQGVVDGVASGLSVAKDVVAEQAKDIIETLLGGGTPGGGGESTPESVFAAVDATIAVADTATGAVLAAVLVAL